LYNNVVELEFGLLSFCHPAIRGSTHVFSKECSLVYKHKVKVKVHRVWGSSWKADLVLVSQSLHQLLLTLPLGNVAVL
jgi:hypothetical protein